MGVTERLILRVGILESEPEIWRRLAVDPRLTLDQLHGIIQRAFGWKDCHLHAFEEEWSGQRYAIPSEFDVAMGFVDPPIDTRRTLLADVLAEPGTRFAYEYDFGDSWVHLIDHERTVEATDLEVPPDVLGGGRTPPAERAAICLDGARNGPPEDCGGVWGLAELLSIFDRSRRGEPLDDEEQWRLEWVDDWDPESFDPIGVNGLLARFRVRKANLAR